MKIVYRTGDYTDFLVCRSKLEHAGLHMHSDNFESYSVMPELGLSDGYRLWVLDEDYDEAHSLLTEAAPEKNKSDGTQQLEADAVLKFSKPMKWMAIAAAAVILLAASYQGLFVHDHEVSKYLGRANEGCNPNHIFC